MKNTFSYKLEAKALKRIEADANGAQIREQVVASYDGESLVLKKEFANKRFRSEIQTFLAENELRVSLQTEGVALDPHKDDIPKRPKADPSLGDATPAVVEWFKKYKPNEFKTRYGVHDRTFTGKVKITEARYIIRERDGQKEFRGNEVVEKTVEDALVSDRKTHLTYTPAECLGYENTEDEEN